MKRKIIGIVMTAIMIMTLIPASLMADEYNGDIEPYSDDIQAVVAASIEGTEYASLGEAVSAANDGQTIVLKSDISLDTILSVNPESFKAVTLDLNNYKITMSDAGENTDGGAISLKNIKVTVTDNSDEKNGTIESNNYSKPMFTLEEDENNKTYLSIEGGTFRSNTDSVISVNGQMADSEKAVSLSGGKFNKQIPSEYFAEGYSLTDNGDGTWSISEAQETYYTISWVNYDGAELETDQVMEGQTPEYTGETPTRPEDDQYTYTFTGWDREISQAYEDTSYTAQYTTEEKTSYVTVVFSTAHGTTPDSQTVNAGAYAEKPEDPAEDGYIFEGWYTDQDYTTFFDFGTPVTADMTLYAKWMVAVTFSSDQGITPEGMILREGDIADRPSDPTAEGYIFGGWYTDAECTNQYDFDTPVTQSITLYAKWIEQPTETQPETPTETPTETQTETPTETQTETSAPEPTTAGTVVVTFTTVHGTAPDPQTIEIGGKVSKPADPAAEGYIFGGWYTDEACSNAYNFDTQITEYMVLYAKWTEEPTTAAKYSVSFYTAHGTNPDGQIIEEGGKVSKPADPAASGYIFGGWYTDEACSNAYDFNAPVTANMTLYAKWTEEETTIQYFKISFYSEKGTIPEVQTIEKGYTAYKPTDPTEPGYVFSGWYKEKECKNPYDFNEPVTANMTLYAKWVELPSQEFIVSFYSNGHGNAPDAQTVKSGEMAVKPTDPTATGYIFTGWFTDAAATQAFDFKSPVTGDVTLYAGWSAIRYTVKFDANGGVGTMASMNLVFDIRANLTANTYTKTGYTFIGWNTKADGSGTAIADNAVVVNMTAVSGATVELFAQWRNNYNVIEGISAKVQKGGNNTITFRADGDYSKFTGITIDKNNVGSSQYSSWSGSTYVQLKAEFVNQLSTGTHTITFNYTDGSCQTTFDVLSSTPKTGDTNNIIIWIIIAIVCLILIVIVILILLKKRNNERY